MATAKGRMTPEGDTIFVANDELGFANNSSTATGRVTPEGDTIFVAHDELGFQNNSSTATHEFPGPFRNISSKTAGSPAFNIPKTAGSSAFSGGTVQQKPGSSKPTTKRQNNAQYSCPFYVFDSEGHPSCRAAVMRYPADIRKHIKDKHKAPDYFCPRCWEIFESTEQLAAHLSRTCAERTFPHCWARPEDWEAIDCELKDCKGSGRRWFAIYRAIFSCCPDRVPSFFDGRPQDYLDCVSSFAKSQDFQEMMDEWETNSRSEAKPILIERFFAYLKRDENFGHSAHVLDETEPAGSQVISTASMQQTMSPPDGQADSQGAASPSLSAVDESSQTTSSSQRPSHSHVQGWNRYDNPEFGASVSQTAQLQAMQYASGSTQSPGLNATDQETPEDHPAHAASQTSKEGYMSPPFLLMSPYELSGQDFLMQGSTHAPAPPQANIAGQAPEAEAQSFSMDSDPGQFNEYMNVDNYVDPYLEHMLIDSDPAQSDPYMVHDGDLSSPWNLGKH